MARVIAIVALVAVLGLLAGTFFLTQNTGSDDQFAQCRAGQIAGGNDQIGGAFTLVSETGETVTDADVIDQPSLIYFGYTYCPDICPADAARNAEVIDVLENQGQIVKPVFISIDPSRDTPETLAEYTDYLHPRMIGLTGSEEQVKAASQAYRTYYKKQVAEDGDDAFYLMDHSTMSYLSLPGHGFVEFFRRDMSAEQVAEKVSCFLKAG